MKIRSIYEYDKSNDRVVKPGYMAQVVLVRGLFQNWRQPIYFDIDIKITAKYRIDIPKNEDYLETAKFIETTNNWFDLFNSKIPSDVNKKAFGLDLFSILRYKGGMHDHPSALELKYRLRNYIIGKKHGFSFSSNIEVDQEQAEQLNFDVPISSKTSKIYFRIKCLNKNLMEETSQRRKKRKLNKL